ncbi:hypothetical protein LTR85_008794 [Meristemomyces frigidus]|nr:hypothetical protein LTR85_008794 [Meristemomyces frigidus]
MPHKHTRRKDAPGQADYNLAPSVIAKPLPAFDKAAKPKSKGKPDEARKQKLKRKRVGTDGYKEDDTPRAFARIMQFQTTGKRPSGLDEGTSRKSKKQKTGQTEKGPAPTPAVAPPKAEVPKIQPGESLADYAARVDQALPMGGLTRKGTVKIEGIKERRTKTERRMHKMYDAWREEEARRKEKLEEQQELEEEEEDEKQAEHGGQNLSFPEGRKGKRRRMVGEDADDDDDPWEVLKERRDAPKGLHDVVQAPPTLKAVKEKFKVRNGAKVDVANVPSAAGSLKRREELGDARRDVIERYRAMMRGKGGI